MTIFFPVNTTNPVGLLPSLFYIFVYKFDFLSFINFTFCGEGVGVGPVACNEAADSRDVEKMKGSLQCTELFMILALSAHTPGDAPDCRNFKTPATFRKSLQKQFSPRNCQPTFCSRNQPPQGLLFLVLWTRLQTWSRFFLVVFFFFNTIVNLVKALSRIFF